MSKRPGRKPESSFIAPANRKRQLSSDAKIIITLSKKQPQTKEEIREKTQIKDRTFYRITSFLQEKEVIKCIDGMFALKDFDFLEKKIEDAFCKLFSECQIVYPDFVVAEVGKPWPEIQAATYKIANKLGLTITKAGSDTIFLKMQQNTKADSSK